MTSSIEAIHQYLERMDRQRQQLIQTLEPLSFDTVWTRPAAGEWSVGEVLAHMHAVYGSFLGFIRICCWLSFPYARLSRRSYPTWIDDVYRRPSFPQNVGWLWPPRYTPEKPTSLRVLIANIEIGHSRFRQFYAARSPDILGRSYLWDPAIGVVNMIQALKVIVDHDLLHIEQIEAALESVSSEQSTVNSKDVIHD